ncbi:MAG: penicillin-binding protein 2 [Alphaproteobacteria bacterium]|nr:MAG: penicillin-binding protein 2 [Alphaproteobacteria bacterium]
MSRDYERQRQFSRRAFLFGVGQGAIVAALAARLYYLQVIEGERYTVLSEENRINLQLIIPPRGIIKDRNGVVLAENARNFRLNFIPEKSDRNQTTLDYLSEILDLTPNEIDRIFNEMEKRKAFDPILVRDNLKWDVVAKLQLNNLDLPGASIEVGQSRFYPYEEVTSHVLGYVGPVSEYELSKNIFGNDPILRTPQLRVGKKGIEKQYEKSLRGEAGSSQMEVNAYGRIIRELEKVDGHPGESMDLTLDIEVQKLAMERLTGQSGSAVVMDANTGGIIALASAPGFNPNLFNNGISIKDWEELLNNARAPLTNKAIAGLYAPGSTYKIVTALSALEYGTIDPGYRVYCDGSTSLGSAQFHCWKKGGHGTLDLTGAIRESCDVYFYDVAMKLGVDRLAETARKIGLAKETGVDIPGEKSGLIPDRRWKQARFKAGWHKGETLVAGIGQGYVLTTPLQLAVMAAHVVNGGRQITPHIRALPELDQVQDKEGLLDRILRFNKNNLAFLKEAMNQVVNAGNGTAHGARITVEGMEMGGKTGTAQVKRISMAERARGVTKNEDRPWKDRDHALFIGFAPVSAPKFVAAVVVEHGGGGSAVAAPIARDLLLLAQQRLLPQQPQPETAENKPETTKEKSSTPDVKAQVLNLE